MDEIVQDRSTSIAIANALELPQSCTKPSVTIAFCLIVVQYNTILHWHKTTTSMLKLRSYFELTKDAHSSP